MAGVLERIRWPQKRTVIGNSSSAPRVDLRVLELQAAKEILAEVFRVRVSEVNEMILSRFEEASIQEACPEEDRLWPQEFRLEK